MKRTFLIVGILTLSAASAAAQERCFGRVQEWRDTVAICSGGRNMGNSADFTAGPSCTYQPAGWVMVEREVECPPPPPEKRWVNVINSHADTHASVCQRAGMRPATIEGAVCASGRNIPRTGEGWEQISYIHGNRSSINTRFTGGNSVETRDLQFERCWTSSHGGQSPCAEIRENNPRGFHLISSSGNRIPMIQPRTYCWGNGQYPLNRYGGGQYMSPVHYPVAYACEGVTAANPLRRF